MRHIYLRTEQGGGCSIAFDPKTVHPHLASCKRACIRAFPAHMVILTDNTNIRQPNPTPARIASHARVILVATHAGVGLGLGPRLRVAVTSHYSYICGQLLRFSHCAELRVLIASYAGPHAERGRWPGDTWQNSRMCTVSITV